ncbi:hypothetical protein E0W68_03190 [Flavobacterium salilacus subsp. salilacus]|uniref:hypothetical protein n=1 Tax=Flavobacterium TaxID=237 RepID=UPI001074FBD9|nr:MULTISPECIES: hypothetical protein [Flavobacterium]KAF2519367.1 hypothetical protein E0W68_03190 [Flavobacterium salilacus subsp. salilacus]MBE1614742.1 hypothetical protein [Flavobacterium sp. SaA2.13]NDI98195.1 hypothetical protein [Flavobacterium salilacus subsp. altitudinum]
MKKIKEALLRKESSINKVQYDKEWFYSIKDMADYLNEDLTGVEYIHLPMVRDGVTFTVKCATWEDIQRILQKEPLQEFKGSILKNKTVPKGNK